MIVINKKEDCCGCSACVCACPVDAISMLEDNEGFLYPQIDVEVCIECGKCERVCPIINRFDKVTDYKVYAARNLNEELRRGSSSGGVFSALADKVLSAGGVVFGAAFDGNNHLEHTFVDNIADLDKLRRSKYLQSDMGDTFNRVREFLKGGREVLFVGTPCQVAGLSHFLGKEYANLLKVDIVCHSVPSPKVFHAYLKELFGDRDIKDINFRDKSKGWLNYSLTLTQDNEPFAVCFRENPYMRGFLRELFSRPSCSECPAKALTSGSDLMLGDFWGVEKFHPSMTDNKGTSLVIVASERGWQALSDIEDTIYFEGSIMERAVIGNPRIMNPTFRNAKRDRFFANFGKVPLSELIVSLSKESKYKKMIRRLKKALKKFKRR